MLRYEQKTKIQNGGNGMNLATKMQEKLEDIWNENWVSDRKRDKVKAVTAALCSGAIDGFVLMGPIMLAGLFAKNHKIAKLQNKQFLRQRTWSKDSGSFAFREKYTAYYEKIIRLPNVQLVLSISDRFRETTGLIKQINMFNKV